MLQLSRLFRRYPSCWDIINESFPEFQISWKAANPFPLEAILTITIEVRWCGLWKASENPSLWSLFHRWGKRTSSHVSGIVHDNTAAEIKQEFLGVALGCSPPAVRTSSPALHSCLLSWGFEISTVRKDRNDREACPSLWGKGNVQLACQPAASSLTYFCLLVCLLSLWLSFMLPFHSM